MKVFSWNVEGLQKIVDDHSLMLSVRCSDILCFQETWALSTISVDGFVARTLPAIPTGGRNAGGQAIYLREALFGASEVSQLDSHPMVLALRIKTESQAFIIASVYIEMRASTPAIYNSFVDWVYETRSSYPGDQLVIAGDFNADRFRRKPSAFDRLFVDCVDMLLQDGFHIEPATKVLTYIHPSGVSTIDYFMVWGATVESFRVDICPEVSHRPLVATIASPMHLPPMETSASISRRLRRSRPPFSTLLSPLPLAALSRQTVQSIYDFLLGVILFSCSDFRRDAPKRDSWFGFLLEGEVTELANLRALAERHLRELDLNPDSSNLVFYESAKSRYREFKQVLRRKATKRLADSHETQAADSRSVWKLLRRLKSSTAAPSLLPCVFVSHFRSVLFDRLAPLDPLPRDLCFNFVSFLDAPFSKEELFSAIEKANLASAPGPDGLFLVDLVELFKEPGCDDYLLCLFNKAFLDGQIPSQWSESLIFTLFKGKGSPYLADNYRAITLQPVLSKLYEQLLYSRLRLWAMRENLVSPDQYAFQSSRSTIDAIFVLQTLIDFYVYEKKMVLHSVLFDLRKAFPSVPRYRLLQFLYGKGLSTRFLTALNSLFAFNSTRLRTSTGLTEPFPTNVGLKEGSVLSPLLFAIYFDSVLGDLFDFADSAPLLRDRPVPGLLFADDLIIFSTSRRGLQRIVRSVQEGVAEKGLQLNRAKCEVFSVYPSARAYNSANRDRTRIFVDSIPLEEVLKVKYLGFFFHAYLKNPTFHFDNCLEKSKVSAYHISKLISSLKITDFSFIRTLYLSFVLSQFYCLPLADSSVVVLIWKSLKTFFTSVYGLPNGIPWVGIKLLFSFSPTTHWLRSKGSFVERVLLPPSRDAAVIFAFLQQRIELMPRSKGFFTFNRFLAPFVSLSLIDRPDLWDINELILTAADSIPRSERSVLLHRSLDMPSLLLFSKIVVDDAAPGSFFVFLDSVPFAVHRYLFLFLFGVARWSAFGISLRNCPLCRGVSLDSLHLFTCPCIPFTFSSSALFDSLVANNWAVFYSFFLQALDEWNSRVSPFELSSSIRREIGRIG